MDKNHLLLLVLWVCYCVVHSVLAAAGIKEKAKNILRERFKFYRLGYTIFSFVALVGILLFQVNISSPVLFALPLPLLIIASIFAATGAALVMLNIIKYFVQLSGISWLVAGETESRLERSGLHKYVRHPLYLSTFVFIWGLWFVYPYLSLLIANTVITIYTLIALRFEERKLIMEFGDEYRKYQREVSMIIPGVW